MVPDRPFDQKGCEDPRLVRFGETYYMTYVGNAGGDYATQCLATSADLIHWDKKGVVLNPEGWNKGQVKAGVIVPEKIDGKYVMYFAGQTQAWHTSLGMAVSDDLLHWSQPLDHALVVAAPRPLRQPRRRTGTHAYRPPGGNLVDLQRLGPRPCPQDGLGAVLQNRSFTKIVKRCETPFIEPQFPYEIDGRHVFTFTEGAAHFKGLWRFYYGAADKTIGLAEIEEISTLLKATP